MEGFNNMIEEMLNENIETKIATVATLQNIGLISKLTMLRKEKDITPQELSQLVGVKRIDFVEDFSINPSLLLTIKLFLALGYKLELKKVTI